MKCQDKKLDNKKVKWYCWLMQPKWETITAKEIRQVLRDFCADKKQGDVARALGISQQYLSLMLGGTRTVSNRIANKLGYKRIILYIKSEDSAVR